MLVISKPIIVEGKYDKIKLSSIVKANIITTEGFGIFSAPEKTALIRRLAEKDGVIVLTDSDGAGFVIRNHLRNHIPKDKLIHLYIPQVKGREKRKIEPSKEGYLGVEGIERETLEALLLPYADGKEPQARMSLSKSDFYALGLSGKTDSVALRGKLAKALALPESLSANALLAAVNLLISQEEFTAALEKIKNQRKTEEP